MSIRIERGSVIAVAGKGGTGKTTISGLIIKHLHSRGIRPVLAIDADPSNCLGDLLAIKVRGSIGAIREDALEVRGETGGMSKREYFESQVEEIITETDGLDLLVMGRPEGPGCYCFVNSILRDVVDRLAARYAAVVIDCEAGLEHLSRRTTASVDTLLMVSDLSRKGIRSAGVVREMARSFAPRVRTTALLLNRLTTDDETRLPAVEKEISSEDFQGIYRLPADSGITDLELAGTSVLELSDEAPVYRALAGILSLPGSS